VRDEHREREYRAAPHVVSGGRGGFGNIKEAKERSSGETESEDRVSGVLCAWVEANGR
jgi:hypothetical protein